MEPVAVDLARRDDPDARCGSAQPTTARKSSSRSSGATCFESFRLRERPDAMVAQARVVEQDAGDDERAGERAASGLVGARDEPRAEPPVEAEEPLTAATRHAPRIAPSSARLVPSSSGERVGS